MTDKEEAKKLAKDLVAYRFTQINLKRSAALIEKRKKEFKAVVNSGTLKTNDEELNKFLMFAANIDDYTDEEVIALAFSYLK
mgnify:CR=1 FL=1